MSCYSNINKEYFSRKKVSLKESQLNEEEKFFDSISEENEILSKHRIKSNDDIKHNINKKID